MTTQTAIQIYPVGKVKALPEGFALQVHEKYRTALAGLEGFSHLYILWWGNLSDTPEYRSILEADKPYTNGPEKLGIFSTRSPLRPNPVLLSSVFVQKIDSENGIIHTPYIDAENNTPILDIKPYYPFDRIRDCRVPDWCAHWPAWYEESAAFNWQNEFNFS